MKENNIYKNALKNKSDKQLIEILYYEKKNYNYAAIQEVKTLIKNRGISKDAVKDIKREIKRSRRKEYLENAKENTEYGVLELLFEFLLFTFFNEN